MIFTKWSLLDGPEIFLRLDRSAFFTFGILRTTVALLTVKKGFRLVEGYRRLQESVFSHCHRLFQNIIANCQKVSLSLLKSFKNH